MLSLLSYPPILCKIFWMNISIVKRLHESLVVMIILTGMNINDVIFNYKLNHNARCDSLEEPPWLNDGMRLYLKSAGGGRRIL